MKYVYPAIFKKEDSGYFINFPDLESCYTQGDDLKDGMEMAEDVLALTMYGYEKDQREIPKPSEAETLKVRPGEFVTLVLCDTMEYRKMYNSKAVKKTLTIPEWLNEEATQRGINFSQVLQEALLEKCDLQIR